MKKQPKNTLVTEQDRLKGLEIQVEYLSNKVKALTVTAVLSAFVLVAGSFIVKNDRDHQKALNDKLTVVALKAIRVANDSKTKYHYIWQKFYGKNGYAMVSKEDWGKHPEWQEHIDEYHTTTGKGCFNKKTFKTKQIKNGNKRD